MAVNIGGCLYKLGSSVLIVDSVPQGSARDWYEAQPEGAELRAVIGVDRPTLHKSIPELAGQFDYVIIDGAARLEEITASAIRATDFVLIPVRHAGFDLWAVE